jgi:hypothetical protein
MLMLIKVIAVYIWWQCSIICCYWCWYSFLCISLLSSSTLLLCISTLNLSILSLLNLIVVYFTNQIFCPWCYLSSPPWLGCHVYLYSKYPSSPCWICCHNTLLIYILNDNRHLCHIQSYTLTLTLSILSLSKLIVVYTLIVMYLHQSLLLNLTVLLVNLNSNCYIIFVRVSSYPRQWYYLNG